MQLTASSHAGACPNARPPPPPTRWPLLRQRRLHGPEIWQPEELANETGRRSKPRLGLLSRPWLLPSRWHGERGRGGAGVNTASPRPHRPTVAPRPGQATRRSPGLRASAAQCQGFPAPQSCWGSSGWDWSCSPPPSWPLFGLPNTPSDTRTLPQPTEGDEDGGGQGLAEAPQVPLSAGGGAQHWWCHSPTAPIRTSGTGGPSPRQSPAGKGEGAGGRARRTKKAAINYSSGEVK